MTDIIEQDALSSTWVSTITQTPSALEDHAHEVKSFVATPRIDQGVVQKLLTWWKAELRPGLHITQKGEDGLRHMFLITSNSYEDRDNETITTDALKAYEESCYPGEGLFHCDNPLLWWHDDDVPMGEIVAVNVSGPFLVEVAKELPTRVSRVLWDYAEQKGDSAGVSHRFGYMEKDRDPDGTYQRIFKQETSYLPERGLAANIGTYAGVMTHMANEHSNKRLDEIFEQVAGIKGASAKLHAKSGALEQELAAAGIQHKATKPPVPPLETDAVEGTAEAVEEVVEAEAKAPADMGSWVTFVNQIYGLVMQMVDDIAGGLDREMALAKQLKALEEARTAEKSLNQTLEQRITILEKRLNLQPRSATQQQGLTVEAAKSAIGATLDQVEGSRRAGELEHVPGWGDLLPAPKTTR